LLDENLEKQILSGSIMLAIVSEEGELSWIVSGKPTKKQNKQFQKMYVVSNNPSLVLKTLIYVEITMLKFLVVIENLFKKGK
jgi:hypothetical protein